MMLSKTIHCHKGMTLMELLVTLSITTLLISIGMTSYMLFNQKSQIFAVTRMLSESLRVTRQWSLVTNQKYYLDINTDTPGRCWGISADLNCSCETTSVCSLEVHPIKPKYAQISITSNRDKLLFSPLFGYTNGATYKLSNQAFTLHIIVSTIGRIRICMAKGDSALYASC